MAAPPIPSFTGGASGPATSSITTGGVNFGGVIDGFLRSGFFDNAAVHPAPPVPTGDRLAELRAAVSRPPWVAPALVVGGFVVLALVMRGRA